MFLKFLLFILMINCASFCQAQKKQDSIAVDSSFYDYETLFSELDLLLDSLISPRSFTLVNLGIGNGFFSYPSASDYSVNTRRRFTYAPSLSYYDKSGLGISAGSAIVNDGSSMNPYQFSVTGSYDFMKNRNFITGISFSKIMTKHDLPFYTSPLQNEVFAYFTYRKSYFKPSVSMSYGWGNRDDYDEREEKIQNIQLAQQGFTRITTRESIADFNLIASVRHDYYLLDVLSNGDYLRFTPQLSFISGTQQFGFNQTSNTYATVRRNGRSVLYNTENVSLDNQLYFQPISLMAFLKTEYTIRKFYVQPQLVFDYYFPASENNFSTSFVINTGLFF